MLKYGKTAKSDPSKSLHLPYSYLKLVTNTFATFLVYRSKRQNQMNSYFDFIYAEWIK